MLRVLAAALACALAIQDTPAPTADKSKLHDELAASATAAGEQLIKLKSWDEARAFLELIRAKSDARAEALDKVLAKTEKQSSGLKWDAKSSDLIKAFGAEQAKKFHAFATACKETDAQTSRWTQAEGEILDDLLDYVKAYARLTQIRAHYELPKTRFDWKLSVPAVWHAKYELLNPDDQIEIEGKNGFSPEGKQASKKSITSSDETLSELLEGLLHAPYYRNYVLNPGLHGIGLGQARGTLTSSVIDVKSRLGPIDAGRSILASPKHDSDDTSVSGYDDHIRVVKGKSMRSLGYPITLIFFDPNVTPKEVKARILERMKDVEFYLSTPELPTVPSGTPNLSSTIAIVPKDVLKPATEYSVSIRYQSNGKEYAVEWSFRTRR